MDRLPPQDFIPVVTNSPATDAMAPLYSKSGPNAVFVGTFVRPSLCNGHGTAHGGVIAAIADFAMGLGYASDFRALHGELRGLLTVQMAIDYIGPGALGTWLQFNPRVVYAGKTRGLIDALIFADDTLIARASAAFRPVV
jgi:acyl-coenzyme A thioesterase PaaI-like protein